MIIADARVQEDKAGRTRLRTIISIARNWGWDAERHAGQCQGFSAIGLVYLIPGIVPRPRKDLSASKEGPVGIERGIG